MSHEWYEGFFEGIVVDMWRRALSEDQTRREAEFLRGALKLRPGDHVIDVPCGLGRHALELAALGFHLTGVDLSGEMIAQARRSAQAAGHAIEWRQAEMRDLPWEGAFDAGYCFGNSFGFLDEEGTPAFLRAVSRALKPGGRFALDYGMAAECILPRLREREWARLDDILFLEENRYDPAESRLETTYTFVRDGEPRVKKGLHWVYTVRETRSFLRQAGLVAEGIYSSLDRAAFEPGAPCLYLVAVKP